VKQRLAERGGIWLAIGLAHAALLYVIANASVGDGRMPEPQPIEASLLQERPRDREVLKIPPPPLSVPRAVYLDPPLIELPQEPSTSITAFVQPDSSPAPSAVASNGNEPKMTTDVAYVQRPAPQYPPESRRAREEGLVVLRVLIDEAGRARDIEVHRSSGHPRLDEAACHAVARALFRPFVEGGSPRAVFAMIPIEFSLKRNERHRGA